MTTTIHVLNASKYQGAYLDPETEDAGDGWLWISAIRAETAEVWAASVAGTSAEGSPPPRVRFSARPEDLFPTEEEARAEGKARRAPRRPRQPQRLYGDFAQLAAFHGIRTDGSGKVNR